MLMTQEELLRLSRRLEKIKSYLRSWLQMDEEMFLKNMMLREYPKKREG